MPIDSNIALGVKPLQIADPLAQYSQVAQIQNAQTQQQAAQLQLQQLQRSADYANKMQEVISQHGGPDIETAAKLMLGHPDPNVMMHGVQLTQAIKDKQQFNDLMGKLYPQAAAPAAPMTPQANIKSGELGSGTYGLNENIPGAVNQLAPPTVATPVSLQAAPIGNQLAPATPAAPVVNQLTAPGTARVAELQKNIFALGQLNDPRAKVVMEGMQKELNTLQTQHVVPNVGLVSGAGVVSVPAVPTPTNLNRLQAEMNALPPNDPQRTVYANAIQKESQNAPTQLAQLIKERNGLAPNDPNRKLYDTAINKTQTEIDIQKAHLKLAQDKYNQDYAQGTFKPETIDMMANLLIQTGSIPPLGMGKKAADARAQIMNRASEISTGAPGATAAGAASNLASNKAEYAGTMSGSRAIGTQIANVQVAANETNRMIGVAKPYVDKVDPTDYPAVNAVGNYVAKNTGDPNIVGLATSLNAIVNTYARAINPKGVATVSDKNHAREILNAAMSKGQLNEAFNVMQQEMNASLASGPETKAGMRSGNAPATTPAPAGAVDTSNKWLR